MKTCSKCEIEKSVAEFYPQKTGKNGLCAHCKECTKALSKAYRDAHNVRLNKYLKKWREGNQNYITEYRKSYYTNKRNADAVNRKSKEWYRVNKKYGQKKRREYHKKIAKNILDPYVIETITKRSGLSAKDIKVHPELIEVKRLILKTHRL